ncbi:OmpA family protein [Leptospira idonii]|uniref:OmpA family protein n=1 Tax=Leptospira idonii TaxID=1193500 RepID=A0A4R9M5C1_9LEPT|nr:OmpA family protein [Leptospira idonii]TGN20907.1 OmpA family protein [Leptospira idonii]
MAESYYRTIKGKQYDRELLEIVEKAVKRTKAPISKTVAKNLFEAIKDGNDYTEIEKRTVKYIRDNFAFSPEADEYLRTEIRKWAAKISVPSKKTSSKKQTAKRTKKEASPYEDSDSDFYHPYQQESEEEIAPTPEYQELVELNRYGSSQKSNNKRWIIVAGILVGILLLIFLFRMCSSSSSKKGAETSKTVKTDSSKPSVIQLERKEVETGKVTSEFKSRPEAIHYINHLQIRFIKHSLEMSEEAPNQIATLASALKSYPGIKIRVKGHTCFIGELDENKILSDERAKFIKDELEKQGVDSSQLDYRGFGETTSVASNYTESGRILNRRVDFSVLSVDPIKKRKK